jgi:glycosyltransferase involved in cell wall biosynthesis
MEAMVSMLDQQQVRRVFAWQTDGAGCFHYRIQLPLTALNQRPGWSCTWGAPGPDIHTYDVVIGQRLAGDNPPWLALCADPNVLAVYDFDDDLVNIEPENEVPYRIYHPIREGTIANLAAADVVTTATETIAEIARAWNPNVVVLPICIPAAILDLPRPPARGEPLLGWAGSMFQGQNWTGMPEVLAEYAARVPTARFHTIGADYLGPAFAGRKDVTGWGTMEQLYSALNFDIGIAPLDRALHGSRVRSHTKVLQYAARGIPAVATAVGEYLEWVEEGVNGLLVNGGRRWFHHDWLDQLLWLTEHPDARAEMGAAAAAKAREYTIEGNIWRWEEAFSSWD